MPFFKALSKYIEKAALAVFSLFCLCLLTDAIPAAFAADGKPVAPAASPVSGPSAATPPAASTTAAPDIFPDTWVATDDLGRKTPTAADCPLKSDKPRTVGIFYVTWHTQCLHDGKPYGSDVTKVLEKAPEAAKDFDHPAWPNNSYHWGEPEYGYFLSRDEYVIRHDMSMLADAGVDVIILDVTNAVHYWDEWNVIFKVMTRMKEEGNAVPKFCFWAFNGNVIDVVQKLYDEYYKLPKYQDLWFYWDGKPLLLYNANPSVDANHSSGGMKVADYSPEVKEFFTLRNMWWGYYEWAGERFVGTEDNWSFGLDLGDSRVAAFTPEELTSKHRGRLEEYAVTPAQHAISMIGKSWRKEGGEPELDERDMPRKAFVPFLGEEKETPSQYGIYFQDRWDEALSVDPDFVYLNDWNEWTAGKYRNGRNPAGVKERDYTFMRRPGNSLYFVDQYNAEFNRTIAPMKGGWTDNYYMQMVENIRRYKGVREIPVNKGFRRIRIDGKFSDWDKVSVEYLDTRGDVVHRDFDGYGDNHYVDTLGRNDIVRCKVASDRRYVYFYVETASELTPASLSPATEPSTIPFTSAGLDLPQTGSTVPESDWMILCVDTDCDPSTGWCGYDLVIPAGSYECKSVSGNKMELRIPRTAFRSGSRGLSFDFKWVDNPSKLDNIIDLSTAGDTAPNRRFNYRAIIER